MLALVAPSTSAMATPVPPAPPVQDDELEQRLTLTKTYVTFRKETLRSLAHLLYGHRSWWTKLRDDNPRFVTYGSNQRIPKHTEIKYRAPEVGSEYVVQKNDWLVRIAIWRYGDTHAWRQLYERNLRAIAKPDLIHPGDKLLLDEIGTIQLANKPDQTPTTLVDMEGKVPRAEAPPAPQPSPAPPAPPQDLANPQINPQLAAGGASTQPQDDNAGFSSILVGFIALVLGLLAGVVIYYRKQYAYTLIEPRQFGGPHKQSGPDYDVDHSLMPEDDVEVNKMPTYASLTKKWKKYLQILAARVRKMRQ